MDRTALEEYERSVEAQARELLAIVQAVAQGDLDVEFPALPEGERIEALAELADSLETMVDGLREMVAEQERTRTEVETGRQELENVLEEALAVQRRYLREHWERYPALIGPGKGYFRFDDEDGPTSDAWLPAMTEAVRQAETVVEADSEAQLAIPIQLYDEVIGVLGFSREGAQPWSDQDIAAATAVVGEVAEALDKQRLLDETQQALIETENLYLVSAELAEAQSYDDVLRVLRAHTVLGRADRGASLSLFNRPWIGNDVPEWAHPIARWSAAPSAGSRRYALRGSPASDLFYPDKPAVIADTESDPRLDEAVRARYAEQYGIRSILIGPLTVAGQWIGYVDALFSEPTDFSETEIQRLSVLVGQAAIVIQNVRQLEETRARAGRERNLREITARMRGFEDPETLAQTAVRELGIALGRPVFIRLGNSDELSRPPNSSAEGHGDVDVARGGEPRPRSLGLTRGVPAKGGE
ncbi:MAG: GAF domain-containing protein [Anaerolineae bacterium]|jgi:GAF domain-containing protein